MSKLILRTIQLIAVLNTINRTSVYRPHSDLIVEPLLLKHYGFMRNALINRTNVTPDDKHWPVWVWFMGRLTLKNQGMDYVYEIPSNKTRQKLNKLFMKHNNRRVVIGVLRKRNLKLFKAMGWDE